MAINTSSISVAGLLSDSFRNPGIDVKMVLLFGVISSVSGEEVFVPTPENYQIGRRIHDITDGYVYRKCQIDARRQLGLKPDEILLSLIVNTDSLVINKSGAKLAWPVFATIWEIPTHH